MWDRYHWYGKYINRKMKTITKFWFLQYLPLLIIIIIIDYRKGSVLHLVLEKSLRNMSCWQYIIHTCYVIDKNVIILLSNLDSCLGKKGTKNWFIFIWLIVRHVILYLLGKKAKIAPTAQIIVCLILNKR